MIQRGPEPPPQKQSQMRTDCRNGAEFMKIMQLPRSVCGLKTTGTGPFDWAQAYVAFLERYGIIGVWSTLAIVGRDLKAIHWYRSLWMR